MEDENLKLSTRKRGKDLSVAKLSNGLHVKSSKEKPSTELVITDDCLRVPPLFTAFVACTTII